MIRIFFGFFFLALSIACLVAFFYGVFALRGDMRQLAMDGGGVGTTAFLWVAKKLFPKDQ